MSICRRNSPICLYPRCCYEDGICAVKVEKEAGMSTNDQDYKSGMLQGGAPFNAAPEQPAVYPDGMTPEDDKRFNRQWDVGATAQAQDGLVERLRERDCEIDDEAADLLSSQQQTISKLQLAYGQVESEIAALKHDIERSTATNAELASEIAELKAQLISMEINRTEWKEDCKAAEAELDALREDGKRLDWLQDNHTLHKEVEILYVVDGYQITLMHEDGITELSPKYYGNDLRAAIDAAIDAAKPAGGEKE